MKKLWFVLSLIVHVEYSMACDKCIDDSCNGVYVPAYSLYIIGFLIILMLVVIVWLAVLLYLNKKKEYKIFTPQNQLQPVTTNSESNRSFITQTSREITVLKMDSITDSTQIAQPQECHIENNNANLTLSSSSKDLKRSIMDRNTGLGKDFKVYRSVKKPAEQQLILREQMKKICEDALAKSHVNGMTASLKDLNALLQEHKEGSGSLPEPIAEAKEKSSPYSDLEVYDNAPSNIPVGEIAGEAVYDCLPSPQLKNNIIVEDYDTKYLLAISKENLTDDTDSMYINAQYRYTKF